mgnify:CR=1 FL=1
MLRCFTITRIIIRYNPVDIMKLQLCVLLVLLPAVSLASSLNLENYTATVNTLKSELCLPTETGKDCFPVLIGGDTPKGTFKLDIYKTSKKGYGGEILGFHKDGKDIYAVHRVWNGNPTEKRERRIKSNNIADRLITNGCINIGEDGYNAVRNMLVLQVI